MIDQSPRYHFHPSANWMNDPNGLIQWKGQYHLFYQYNPHGPFHGTIHWGHATSTDLLHWTHLPIALAPTPGGPDADGCFSGCAIDRDGTPMLMYTGVVASGEGQPLHQTQCLAIGSDDLLTWTKFERNPIIAAPPAGLDLEGFRDPYVWKDGDGWACIVGSGIGGVGGTVLLYRSPDAVQWDYVGPLLVGDAANTEPVQTGAMWECPQFFPLGDRHVLVLSIMDAGKTQHTVYAVGTYSGDSFTPDHIGRFDLGPDYYAPAVMRDDRGRRLVWGWVREARRRAAQTAAGWSGVMSLPRVLSLDSDGTLLIEPVDELRALRGAHYRVDSIDIAASAPCRLPEAEGDCLEIVAEFDPAHGDATGFGLLVRCAPDDEEFTSILYDHVARTLTVDREHASLAPESYRGVYTGSVHIATDEPVTLRIFLDRSILEVYVNRYACLSARIYPTRPDSRGIAVFARDGHARLNSLDIWRMAGPLVN